MCITEKRNQSSQAPWRMLQTEQDRRQKKKILVVIETRKKAHSV